MFNQVDPISISKYISYIQDMFNQVDPISISKYISYIKDIFNQDKSNILISKYV